MAKLSQDGKTRKTYPVGTGALDYFPDAIADVAHVSYVATQQHHPGQAMHWDRTKSTDHADCLMRHFLERGTVDSDGIRHSAKLAWRALALLQLEIEAVEETKQALVDCVSYKGEPERLKELSEILDEFGSVPDGTGDSSELDRQTLNAAGTGAVVEDASTRHDQQQSHPVVLEGTTTVVPAPSTSQVTVKLREPKLGVSHPTNWSR